MSWSAYSLRKAWNAAKDEVAYLCDHCGYRADRDYNAARNLAGLVGEVTGVTSSPSCGATRNEPAGNPRKTSPAGTGYRHGKTHEVKVA